MDDLKVRILSSIEALANAHMDLSLEEWGMVSRPFHDAVSRITALEAERDELVAGLEEILGNGKKGTWGEAVKPLIARFEVSANFGGDTIHNPTGSAALAELLRSMADKLDWSAESARALLTKHTTRPTDEREKGEPA